MTSRSDQLVGLTSDTEAIRTGLVGRTNGIIAGCLARHRAHLRRDGSIFETPDPDFRSALKGIELIARMLDVLDQKPEAATAAPVTRLPKQELVERFMTAIVSDPTHRAELRRRLAAADDEPEVSRALLPVTIDSRAHPSATQPEKEQ